MAIRWVTLERLAWMLSFSFCMGIFWGIWLTPKTQYSTTTNFLVYHEALQTKFLRLQELLEATKREGNEMNL